MRLIKIKVTDAARDVLERAQVAGNTLKITEQLERSIYLEVNKVLGGIGGKWDRKARAHVFPCDPTDLLWASLETGEVIDEKKTFNMFFTPPDVASRMVDCAEIAPSHRLLEPSAGSGNILRAVNNGNFQGGTVAVEIVAKLAERLTDEFPMHQIQCADFLVCDGSLGLFDRVLMNPPFHNGDDIRHIEHALTMLKVGGRLLAICANGPRQNEQLRPRASMWEDLPDGIFKEEGTQVKTVLLTINKP